MSAMTNDRIRENELYRAGSLRVRERGAMGTRNGKLTPQNCGVCYVAEGLPFHWTRSTLKGGRHSLHLPSWKPRRKKSPLWRIRAYPAFGNLWHQLNAEVFDRCRRRSPH